MGSTVGYDDILWLFVLVVRPFRLESEINSILTHLSIARAGWTLARPDISHGCGSRGLATVTDINVTIEQTWTSMIVRVESTGSVSRSVSANLTVGSEMSLSYEYINEPRVSADATMHTHRGTARFVVKPGDAVLEGDYYSGRDRQTFGTARLERIR